LALAVVPAGRGVAILTPIGQAVVVGVRTHRVGFAELGLILAVGVAVFDAVGQSVVVGVVAVGIEAEGALDLDVVIESVAICVGCERVGLALVGVVLTVAVGILDAVEQRIAVGIRVRGIRLTRVEEPVAVGVLFTVGEPVVVGVGVQWVGLAGIHHAVAVRILDIVGDPVVVGVTERVHGVGVAGVGVLIVLCVGGVRLDRVVLGGVFATTTREGQEEKRDDGQPGCSLHGAVPHEVTLEPGEGRNPDRSLATGAL